MMNEPYKFSFDEAEDKLRGVFFWQNEPNKTEENIRYSESVLNVTGYSGEEINSLKGGWLTLIVKDERNIYKKKIGEFENDSAAEFLAIEYCIIRKDGKIINVSERINVVRNEEKKIIKRFGLVLDVTDYVKKIKDLSDKNDELSLLNSSKDNFISILSHDLRAPFTSILGFSEILLNESGLSENDKVEYLKYIHDSSQNQLQLINYLLDWSRLQTGRLKIQPQRLHAQSLVYNCVSYLTGQAVRKNITISVKAQDSFYIDADERLITQVITNLISNAIKFSKENEFIEINCKVYNDDFIEFVVKDYGAGISEQNSEKLFNIGRIFTTEGTKGEKGSGLGLALAKQIIEKHRGDIWFYSTEGKGSEFHFTVPAASNTILIVIDNKTDLSNLEVSLKESYPGFKILTAENAFEAFGIISAKLPSLVITNHQLPLMDGLKFINTVRKENKIILIPFIVFLDTDSEETVKSYQEIGVKTIKQAPELTEQLKTKVESLLYSFN
jgi:signal transduction histidine kinase/CheY-like chemotaxis protein